MTNINQRHTAEPKKISRRSFLSGIAVGSLGVIGILRLKQNWEFDANRPQLLYEFHEKGSLETAIDESHMERLAHDQSILKQLRIETQLLQGEALKKEVNSPRYIGGL